MVRLEVEEFLRGTFLESPPSPIIAVSSTTGSGLDNLKQAMVSAAVDASPRDSQAIARLPIDRVFSMKGFGTVVTGTLMAGTIDREAELEVFPTGRRVRVRGVQVHGQTSDKALAGQRTALNLAGVATEDLVRGMMLAPSATFVATQTVDVHLRLLSSAPRPLKDRARIHFHSYAMETVGEVVFQRSSALNPLLATASKIWQMLPGSEAFARIKLPQPALLLPGDRFIIRQFSPVATIGGGVVLDAAPIARLKQPTVDTLLRATAISDDDTALGIRIARRGCHGLSIDQAVSETGLDERLSRLSTHKTNV